MLCRENRLRAQKQNESGVTKEVCTVDSILIVDRKHNFGKYFQQQLTADGYCWRVADDEGKTADILQEGQFQLIILEFENVEIELQYIKIISKKFPEIPIIVMGVMMSAEERIQCIEHGARDCVTEKCSALELSARIKAIIRRYRIYGGKRLREECDI